MSGGGARGRWGVLSKAVRRGGTTRGLTRGLTRGASRAPVERAAPTGGLWAFGSNEQSLLSALTAARVPEKDSRDAAGTTGTTCAGADDGGGSGPAKVQAAASGPATGVEGGDGMQTQPGGQVGSGIRDGDSGGGDGGSMEGAGVVALRDGVKSVSLPRRVPLPVGWRVASVAVGRRHVLVLLESGRVAAWGDASTGAVGLPQPAPARSTQSHPKERLRTSGIKSPGKAARKARRGVSSTASGGDGSGDGSGSASSGGGGATQRHVRAPTLLPWDLAVSEIAAGSDMSMALTRSGRVYVWGHGGGCGHLGLGEGINKVAAPTRIKFPNIPAAGPAVDADSDPFTPLEARQSAAAATLRSSRLMKQFLQGSPMLKVDGADAASLMEQLNAPASLFESAHGMHAADADGGAADMVPVGRIARIACGSHHAGCVTENGVLFTWGDDSDGQLGKFSKSPMEHSPTAVDSLSTVFVWRLAMGSSHTLIVSRTGRVYSWGAGEHGALGHNDARSQEAPRLIETFMKDGTPVFDVAAGDGYSMAWTKEGTVFVWGRGDCGNLGTGSKNKLIAPMLLEVPSAGERLQRVACGAGHMLVVCSGGLVLASGRGGMGQLGIQEACRKDRLTLGPISLFNQFQVSDVAVGDDVSFALDGRPNEVTCPALCAACGEGTVAAAWNARAAFRVRCFKEDGLPRSFGGDSVSLSASVSGRDILEAVQIVDGGDGTYGVAFSASWERYERAIPPQTGTRRLQSAVVNLHVLVDGLPIAGSPFGVLVLNGIPVPQFSRLEAGLMSVSVGTRQIPMRIIGSMGAPAPCGGLPIVASLCRTQAGATPVEYRLDEADDEAGVHLANDALGVAIMARSSGFYDIHFNLVDATEYELNISFFGRPIRGSPFQFTASPGVIAPRSVMEYTWCVSRDHEGISGVWSSDEIFYGQLPEEYEQVGYHQVVLSGRDMHNNPLRHGGDGIVFEIGMPDGLPAVKVATLAASPPDVASQATQSRTATRLRRVVSNLRKTASGPGVSGPKRGMKSSASVGSLEPLRRKSKGRSSDQGTLPTTPTGGAKPRMCAAVLRDLGDGEYHLFVKALVAGVYTVSASCRPASLTAAKLVPLSGGSLRLAIKAAPPVPHACAVEPLTFWHPTQLKVVSARETAQDRRSTQNDDRAAAKPANKSAQAAKRQLKATKTVPALAKFRNAATAVRDGNRVKRVQGSGREGAKLKSSSSSGSLSFAQRSDPLKVALERKLVDLSSRYGRLPLSATTPGLEPGAASDAGQELAAIEKPQLCVLQLFACDQLGNVSTFTATTLHAAASSGCEGCQDELARQRETVQATARRSSAGLGGSFDADSRRSSKTSLEDEVAVAVSASTVLDKHPELDSLSLSASPGHLEASLSLSQSRRPHSCGIVVWARDQMGKLMTETDVAVTPMGVASGEPASSYLVKCPWGESINVGPLVAVTFRGEHVPCSPFAVPMPQEFIERVGGGYRVPGLASGGPGSGLSLSSSARLAKRKSQDSSSASAS